jgi:hypothetical protein
MDGAWGMILGKKILVFGGKLLDARFALVILEVTCVLQFLFCLSKSWTIGDNSTREAYSHTERTVLPTSRILSW